MPKLRFVKIGQLSVSIALHTNVYAPQRDSFAACTVGFTAITGTPPSLPVEPDVWIEDLLAEAVR